MSSYLETSLSGIQLPRGFVNVPCSDTVCSTYLDREAIEFSFEDGRIVARFKRGYEVLVITYGNRRRPSTALRSEDWVETADRSFTSDLLQTAMSFLLKGPHFRDGHDAFIYTPRFLLTGNLQEFSRGLVQPVAHPGTGKAWRLLGVIEKT